MDYSNLTRLGICTMDPGAVFGHPSPNAFEPIPQPGVWTPYLNMGAPSMIPPITQSYIPKSRKPEIQKSEIQKPEIQKPSVPAQNETTEQTAQKTDYRKVLGVSSVVLLATAGVAKLVQVIKKIPKP